MDDASEIEKTGSYDRQAPFHSKLAKTLLLLSKRGAAKTTKHLRGTFLPDAAKQLRPTAWLDGLRGFASFQVFLFHDTFSYKWEGTHDLANQFGANEDTYNWWRLPFVRLVWGSGCFMVTIFFVISGFVLTQGFFKHIRAQNYEALLQSVSSAAFRRIIRIWLPVLVTTLTTVCLVHLHIGAMPTLTLMPEQDSWYDRLHYWAVEMNRQMNPFTYKDQLRQSGSVMAKTSWTLPLEIYGSFICYTLAIIMARQRHFGTRLFIMAFTTVWAIYNQSWFLLLFLYGMLLADYDLTTQVFFTETISSTREFQLMKSFFWSVVLLGSLWVAGWSRTFNPFMDHDLYAIWWLSFASCALVTAIYHLPTMRRIFESPAMQYLGKLSFGIYMVHFPIIDILTQPYIRPALVAIFPEDMYNVACGLTVIIQLPIVLLFSQLFELYVDSPSVRAAKQIEKLFISYDGFPSKTVIPT